MAQGFTIRDEDLKPFAGMKVPPLGGGAYKPPAAVKPPLPMSAQGKSFGAAGGFTMPGGIPGRPQGFDLPLFGKMPSMPGQPSPVKPGVGAPMPLPGTPTLNTPKPPTPMTLATPATPSAAPVAEKPALPISLRAPGLPSAAPAEPAMSPEAVDAAKSQAAAGQGAQSARAEQERKNAAATEAQRNQAAAGQGAQSARAEQERKNAAATEAQKNQAATGQEATAGAAAQAAKNAAATASMKNQAAAMADAEKRRRTPDTHPAASSTPPATWGDSLADFQDFYAKMVNDPEGFFKQYFATATNRIIQSMGMMNQSERDAMQMRINQDPSAKMIDMQKYGLQGAFMVNQEQRNRSEKNFNTLVSNGMFDQAASSLQGMIDKDFPGLGITVDAGVLRGRDALNRSDQDDAMDMIRTTALTDKAAAVTQANAMIAANPGRFPPGMTGEQWVNNALEDEKRGQYSMSQFSSKMDRVREIATVDPVGATAMLQAIMDDPAYKSWFPEGATADQIIKSFQAGNTSKNLQESQTIQEEINRLAASPTASFDEALGLYDDLFRLTGRDAVKDGKRLTLEQINTLRTGDGLGEFQKDAQGNIVDETGISLTDEDYTDLAYRKDFADRQKTENEAPLMDIYNQVMKSPDAIKFTNPEFFIGGKDALKNWAVAVSESGLKFIRDPNTGQMVPDLSGTEKPWDDPALAPMFYTWPKANFDATGQVTKDANGNPIYDGGGDVYGETLNGEKVMATADDEAMDNLYFKYRRQGGNLTAKEWYFATAGGTLPPDVSRVPKDVTAGAKVIAGLPGDPKTGEMTGNLAAFNSVLKADATAETSLKVLNGVTTSQWQALAADPDAYTKVVSAAQASGAIKAVETAIPELASMNQISDWLKKIGVTPATVSAHDGSAFEWQKGKEPIISYNGKMYKLTLIKSKVYYAGRNHRTTTIEAIDLETGSPITLMREEHHVS